MSVAQYKKTLTIIIGVVWLLSAGLYAQNSVSVIGHVNPMVGTANSTTASALKHGAGTEQLANTIPAVTYPFGMTQWVAQTRATETKCLAPYYYKDSLFQGFRGSHWISGSCMQDYGSVTVTAVTGKLRLQNNETFFSHKDEISTPAYYKVVLPAYNLTGELTATKRCGFIRFTALKDDSLYILVQPNSDQGKGFIKIDQTIKTITGYNPVHRIYQGRGEPAGFSGYFFIQFEKEIGLTGVYKANEILKGDSVLNQFNTGAFVGFKVRKGDVVNIKIGTSFTSVSAAKENLQSEIDHWDFAAVKQTAGKIWNNALSQITIEDSSTEKKNIFYTAMYHAMQHPRLYSDVSGTYPVFAGNYQNAKLNKGSYYDDFSMWDIYRAQIPLFEILQPQLINDCVQSLILKSHAGGWLPNFPCWNSYTSAMVGDHANALIASAYVKGIRDYDVNDVYSIMRKNAFEIPNLKDYKDGRGRRSLQYYLTYGYYPLEDSIKDAFHINEQVSRTLEYAYDDYCVAQIAKALHKTEDYNILMKRSDNYKNVYDANIGFMNGRYKDGSFYKAFNADVKMPFITEGTPRQYSFYVPQDIPGLTQLMDGEAKLENALDELFAKQEYWHGNEPDQQVPFMYNHTAHPYKTQFHVREILADEYADGPGGLSGNDDAGQISAWYVFAALGLYPLDPASDKYELCSPLFSKAKIRLPDGKYFTINVKAKNNKALYIKKVELNGKAYQQNFITHSALMAGGELTFYVEDSP